VIAESRARQEREDRLMAASEAKAKADAEVRGKAGHVVTAQYAIIY
jgi:hypothetical protein